MTNIPGAASVSAKVGTPACRVWPAWTSFPNYFADDASKALWQKRLLLGLVRQVKHGVA